MNTKNNFGSTVCQTNSGKLKQTAWSLVFMAKVLAVVVVFLFQLPAKVSAQDVSESVRNGIVYAVQNASASELAKYFAVDYDEAGSIGKRYRRQDEIGTPFCITIDFDTLEDNTVTVRDRDTMDQVRLPISEVRAYVEERLMF